MRKKRKYAYSYSDTLINFLSRPVRLAVLVILLISVIFPLYWLITNTLKIPSEYIRNPPVMFPTVITLDNFVDIFVKYGALKGFTNTGIVAVATTLVCMFFGSMAAYAIVKGKMAKKLRNFFGLWFMIQKMYPAISIAIPVYIVMRYLSLIDTLLALIIMYTSFNLPLVVWLMIGFFQEVPAEIEQSGIIDGCSMWQRYWLLAMPITKPGLVASGILTFVSAWNEFLFAALLSINRAKPLSVTLAGFITDKGLEWGPMAAMAVLLTVPVIVVVWLMQRDFVAGLSMGSVKE